MYVESDACQNYNTEIKGVKKKVSSNVLNPFSIDNCNDQQILDIANNYITTDESLDNFQKELKNDKNEFGIRLNNIKQKQCKMRENFSFKDQYSKEKTINSNNSLYNNPQSNTKFQNNIHKSIQSYNIANK